MPMYEYNCGKCKKNFEELVYGDEKVCCPKCGSKKVRKLMSRCSHRSGARSGSDYGAASSGGSGCAGCAGGNCGSCH